MAQLGRPSSYTQERADQLCGMLADGMSLRSVCKIEGMPDKQTVFRWIRTFPNFLDQYARAKADSADALAEELIDISDDGTNDWMEVEAKNGGVKTVLNGENIQRSRLRVDTRKWLMSKMQPKKYGDKMDYTTNGKDIGAAETQDAIENLLKSYGFKGSKTSSSEKNSD